MFPLILLFLFLIEELAARNHASPSATNNKASEGFFRLPGQVGDSANHLVSSVGHEIGTGVGTIATGVGELPQAIGKAVGSVPDALGHGISHVGDVGLEETKRLAEAVGDTWSGAGGAIRGIFEGLTRGTHAKGKRSVMEELGEVSGMDLSQRFSLFKQSLQQAANKTIQEICNLIHTIQNSEDQIDMTGVATSSIIHTFLDSANDLFCGGVTDPSTQ